MIQIQPNDFPTIASLLKEVKSDLEDRKCSELYNSDDNFQVMQV